MKAPGKILLTVVSILFIISGALTTVITLISLLSILNAAFSSPNGFSDALLSLSPENAALGGFAFSILILLFSGSVLDLIIGIIGLKKCGNPDKAGFFIITGIILCALSLVSLILTTLNLSFVVTNLIGFVLPMLYIIGGILKKKAAVKA